MINTEKYTDITRTWIMKMRVDHNIIFCIADIYSVKIQDLHASLFLTFILY